MQLGAKKIILAIHLVVWIGIIFLTLFFWSELNWLMKGAITVVEIFFAPDIPTAEKLLSRKKDKSGFKSLISIFVIIALKKPNDASQAGVKRAGAVGIFGVNGKAYISSINNSYDGRRYARTAVDNGNSVA